MEARRGRPIRLVVVEDHVAIARGLAAVIAAQSDIEIAGVAFDAEQATELIAETKPDVVLCDVMLDRGDSGFDLVRRHGDGPRFLMYSAFDLPSHHAQSVKLGAAGYISKVSDLEVILHAVHHVAAGGRWYAPDVMRSARQAPRQPTARERQLLALLVEGASNEEIATRLGIGIKTVEGTIRRLFDRYAVDNRTQLARLVERQGWLTPRGGGQGFRSARR